MLENKIAFITGSSRGIGRATAIEFARQGAQLVLHARQKDTLIETVEAVKEYSSHLPLLLEYDVKDYNSIKQAIQTIRQEFGRLDVLVNNAGIMEESLLGMIRKEMVENLMQTNLQSVLYHMQYASRLMMKQKEGSIINVSSIIGTNGSEGNVVYAASKAGLIGVTKSASKELASFNIRVNAVAPGFIETHMTSHYQEEQLKKVIGNIKMKRMGTPEEVANVMLFLASNMSSYVTGQVIGVDGGMVI